nr:AraC family transcriptional regulator [Cohnella sp. WQ 127256]
MHQPYRLNMGGHFLANEPWSHMARKMSEYELLIGVSENVYLEVEGEPFEIKPGDVMILKPGQFHQGYKPSLPGVSFYWFHFMQPEADGREPDGMLSLYAECANPNRIHILARQLLHAANGGYSLPNAGDYFLSCLLIELVEQGRNPNSDPKLADLLEWIRLHALEQDLTVERIAAYSGYNKQYLTRIFKRNFGSGLLKYVHSIKLESAKRLLAGSKLYVKEVAMKVGFADEKQFAKWFKLQSGVTPTAYREAFTRTHFNNV